MNLFSPELQLVTLPPVKTWPHRTSPKTSHPESSARRFATPHELIWTPSSARTRKPVKVLARRRAGLGQSYSPPDYFDTGWASVFVAGCEAIGANPYDVAGLLINESGFNPSATNSIGCVGLNQLCPGSQNFLSDYTVDQYTQLTVSEQLPYVFAFWQNWMSQYGVVSLSAAELYQLNFLPATFQPFETSSYVISQQGDPYYAANSSLDVDGSGQITLGDLDTVISNAESNNSDLYTYLAEMITLAGGPVAYLPWPWLAGLSFVAGVAGFLYVEKHGRPRWLPGWLPG